MPALPRSFPASLLLPLLLAACGAAASPAASTSPSSRPAAPVASSPAAASAKPASSAAASPAAGLKPVKVAIPTKGSEFVWLYFGKDAGIFQKHGLDLQIGIVAAANEAAALTSGDIDFAATSLTRAGLNGLPVRNIMFSSNKPGYVVVGAKGLTSPDQLRGKTLTSDAPDTLGRILLTAFMTNKGIKPNEYKVVTGNSEQARIALVTTGTAQAAIVTVPGALQLTRQGYPIIGQNADIPSAPTSGLGASQSFLQAKRDFVIQSLQAGMDSLMTMKANKDEVLPIIEKEFSLDADGAGQVYDTVRPNITDNGKPNQAAIQFELSTDQELLQLKEPPKPEQLFDFSILDQLAASGHLTG